MSGQARREALANPLCKRRFIHLTGGKAKHHENTVLVGRIQLSSVEVEKELQSDESRALVAVDEWMIAGNCKWRRPLRALRRRATHARLCAEDAPWRM